MPPLTRQPQKVFASNANADMLAVFGSMKTGTPQYATSLATLQSSDYLQGWQNAILDDKAPYLEEMNAVQYGLSYQIAYMLQEGIPAYDATTLYSNTSLVKQINGNDTYIYRSLANDNTGNSLSNTTYWKLIYVSKPKTISLTGAVTGSGTLDLGNTNNISISTSLARSAVTSILSEIYPVGSIYLTTASTCPLSSIFTSTWILVSQDRCIQGSGTYSAGSTVAASLPNVTGYLSRGTNSGNGGIFLSAGGAFALSNKATLAFQTVSNNSYYRRADFSAYDSNSMYSGSTVQPSAYVVNVFRRTA